MVLLKPKPATLTSAVTSHHSCPHPGPSRTRCQWIYPMGAITHKPQRCQDYPEISVSECNHVVRQHSECTRQDGHPHHPNSSVLPTTRVELTQCQSPIIHRNPTASTMHLSTPNPAQHQLWIEYGSTNPHFWMDEALLHSK